ncbi:MAG: NAD(P)H-dependent oxidoreductase subunit E [Dehalococcoidia bacterium]|nr:NAD(P)H-dependent oxidoreductase subunit E [Dehalococcoidia bacterium]
MRDAEARRETIGHLINELHGVDAVIDKYQGDKSSLIQILLDVEAQLHWLPKSALRWVSERLGVPLAQVYNIATFYKAFNLLPQGRHVALVCLGTTCHVQGGPRLLDKVEQVLGIKPGETTPDQKFTLQTVNCLGCCALGPVMVVDGDFHGKLAVTKVGEIFDKYD